MSKHVKTETYWAKIYIAGPIVEAKRICRKFVMDGYCVTVIPTTYIYTHGEEEGVEIGLINYPRFPATPKFIRKKAKTLAMLLLKKMHQGSYTIMFPDDTILFSRRGDL